VCWRTNVVVRTALGLILSAYYVGLVDRANCRTSTAPRTWRGGGRGADPSFQALIPGISPKRQRDNQLLQAFWAKFGSVGYCVGPRIYALLSFLNGQYSYSEIPGNCFNLRQCVGQLYMKTSTAKPVVGYKWNVQLQWHKNSSFLLPDIYVVVHPWQSSSSCHLKQSVLKQYEYLFITTTLRAEHRTTPCNYLLIKPITVKCGYRSGRKP